MSKEQYRPLMSDDPVNRWAPSYWASKLSRSILFTLIAVQFTALAVALFLLFSRRRLPVCSVNVPDQHTLYSPALSAVENEVRVYRVGFPGDLSAVFQEPSSPKLDEAWMDLYNFGISWITKEEAAQLPNKTHPIPGDPDGHYIAELNVFHNLHCLNKIRMALDPDYYPDWRISTTGNWIESQRNATEHVGHCLDWIRQDLMCHADTSVIVWQWKDWANSSLVRGDVAHTCRKFNKIQDWALGRMVKQKYDPTVRIDDDIVVPMYQHDMEPVS
ncbi:unnamed protein product [Mycena citricolor]|uniref:Tat pathway signal sequence n=1 Tax=Mycena citricolor TaxID=2018698 RepID=A0AAD2HJK1_9AGAR|nr:unnamed protein product [Mycena citricolor]